MSKSLFCFAFTLFLLISGFVSNAQVSTIATVAGGSGWGGYAGDGLTATDASVSFFRTAGVCADAAGNLYIADWGNYRIRKVSAGTDILSTIAGTGISGFSGDGGPATAALINGSSYPMSLAIDNAGNIYYGDNGNDRIRKINTTTGIITTVAGGGTSSVDGVPATDENIGWYFQQIYVDAIGNIYFGLSNQIKVVNASTGFIYTLAGTSMSGYSGDGGPATSALLNNPMGITGDASGNIYFADKSNNRIRKISPSGIITTFAGTGTSGYSGDGGGALSAQLNSPKDMGKDAVGNIFFADGNGNYIRKINLSSGIISIAGGCTTGCVGGGGDIPTPVPSNSIQTSGDHIFVDAFGNIYYSTYVGWVEKVTTSALSCSAYMVPGVLTATTDIATCTTTLYNTGASPSVSMQWQNSHDNISWTNISGASTASYNFSSLSGTSYYRCAATCPLSGLTAYTASSHIVTSPRMTQAIINSPDTSCSGPDFFVTACGTASTYSVKTWFGDGTSSIMALSSSGISCAHVYHNYYHSGIYSVKQVLMDGYGSLLDSISSGYNYTYCKTLPVRFYFDANFNCNYDKTDFPNHLPVKTEVDSNGIPIDTICATSGFYYKANGPAGTVYTFKIISAPPGLQVTCPLSGICTDTIQYYVNNYPVQDIALNCSSAPGFDLSVYGLLRFASHSGLGDLVINNSYCPPEDAILTLHLSPKYTCDMGCSRSPSPSFLSGNTISWDFSALSATIGAPILLHMSFGHLGPLQPAGDTIRSTVELTPTSGDLNLSNNIQIRCDTVKYAFDPNEMTVSPSGCFKTDTPLQYFIRFENDGNDTAHNIFVLDTLSDNLDPSTFELLSCTHEMYLTKYLSNGHTILKFEFPNINLLDSSYHNQCFGIVMYTIHSKSDLINGSAIDGRAGIYFDDNDVVMTNNIFITKGCDAVNDVNTISANNEFEIYPNPTTSALNIKADNKYYHSYIISNSIGQQLLYNDLISINTKVDITLLPNGLYYIILKGDNGISVRKFVKM